MSKKLWGGRFEKQIDKDFFEFEKSIHYDYKLAEYDIYQSRIHVDALKEGGLLTASEAKKIDTALYEILKEIEKGTFKPDMSAEDIHTDIHNRIEKKVGKLVLKFHTFRSRNEQIAFDTKYYCEIKAKSILKLLSNLVLSFEYLSNKYNHVFIPGYTHTQRAQIISFKTYLGAFVVMFEKDKERIKKFLKDYYLYLGSGALAGSPLSKQVYEKVVQKYKKILSDSNIEIADNPVENVSNRDFVIELLAIVAILQMHLSRLSEDFILFSTKEFNYFNLPEEFCTGSSLMPHKKNPDFLELIRGYTGHVYGNLMSGLTIMKGLPLTYNRDMQLDKESLFSSIEIVEKELSLMARFIKGIKLNESKIDEALKDPNLYATEISQYLVYKGTPFQEAHAIVGEMVKYCIDNAIDMRSLNKETLRKFSNKFDRDVIKLFDPRVSVESKKSIKR